LTKIMRLTYNRSCSHNRPQTAACNAVYSISRRALLITRLGEQLPRPRQVSMSCTFGHEPPKQKDRCHVYGSGNTMGEILSVFGCFVTHHLGDDQPPDMFSY